MNNTHYRENSLSIIRKLERAEGMAKELGHNQTRAYILYFLATIYYKNDDIITAKEKLKDCIEIKSSLKSPAEKLLKHIWNSKVKPPFWRWWLYSPLKTYIKRFVFTLLVASIFLLLIFHPLIASCIEVFSIHQYCCSTMEVNWTIYLALIIFLLFIILAPNISRIDSSGVGIELNSPTDFVPILSPQRIGSEIEKLGEEPKIEESIKINF